MANSFVGWRAQFIFALCLPVAVLLGYMLADPTDFASMVVITLIIGIMSIPVFMYAYHPLLIVTWNAAITPLVLPGQPFLWMLIAFVGLGFAVVNRFTSREAHFIAVPSVSRPLLLLLVVIVVTAWIRGGMGIRIFGSGQYGGKCYFYLTASILGYFALISQRIAKHRVATMVTLFFLSGLTAFIPNLAYLGGKQLDFLFLVFPATYAMEQAMGDYSTTLQFGRVLGLTYGSIALYCWLLARYGLRGIFDSGKPIRLLLFIVAALGAFFSGFRGYMLLFLIIVMAQFVAEKLYTPRVLLMAGLCTALTGALGYLYVEKLPLVVQRSIAFLPLPVDPVVRIDTDASSRWRLDMWRDVLSDLREQKYVYLYKGRGYNINPAELEIVSQLDYGPKYSSAMVTGSYHNGPLTLLIPFGIWGFGAFLLFVIASIKYLHRNYRHGDPDLRTINTFLFAYFVARLIYYTIIFGSFYSDLFVFAGTIALSISINGAEVRATESSEAPERSASRDEGLAAAGAA